MWFNHKTVAIGIIFLFIGVAVAPGVNIKSIKAADEHELIEVTSEICGIPGFGNTTTKLTKQQYQELRQYLISFRAKLNQTISKEQTIPLFREAVVELDKYGLLPKDMSVEDAQKLVSGDYQNQRLIKHLDKLFNKNQYIVDGNLLCLVSGESDLTYVVHRIDYWLTYGGVLLYYIFFMLGWDLAYQGSNIGGLLVLLSFFFLGVCVFGTLLQTRSDMSPLSLMNVFGIGYSKGDDNEVYYGSGWLKTIGLLGVKSWNGSLLGTLPGLKLPYDIGFPILIYPAMWGFCGIKIRLDEDGCQKSFFGTAIAVSIDNKS